MKKRGTIDMMESILEEKQNIQTPLFLAMNKLMEMHI